MNPPDQLNLSDDQLVRIEAVAVLTTLSKSTIALWVAQGKFPKPIRLSATVKVWRMGQLRAWMNDVFGLSGHQVHSQTQRSS